MEPIYIGCDHTLTYDRARSEGEYVTAGTVTYSLALSGGAVVTTGTLAYVADSQGRYQATIDGGDLDSLTEGATYVATITLAAPKDVRTLSYVATRRGAR